MKKATVIVIAAIYVASIVVVGVFGLQALMYDESNPITDIILPAQIEGKDVKLTSDGKGYTVVITYREDLVIPIDFIPEPADSPSAIEVEITYQTGTEEEPTAELTRNVGYFLEFHTKGKVTITFRAKDNSKFSKELSITAR